MVKLILDAEFYVLSAETVILLTELTYKSLYLKLTNLWVSHPSLPALDLESMLVG
jgi:hypothetical protein